MSILYSLKSLIVKHSSQQIIHISKSKQRNLWTFKRNSIEPPKAKKVLVRQSVMLPKGEEILEDNYVWMQEPTSKDVIKHLELENKYMSDIVGNLRSFQNKLFKEMKDRIYDDDSTVPELVDGYYYYTKMNASDNFLQYCRKRSLDGTEEIILDQNEVAKKFSYINIGVVKVSSDQNYLMYTLDSTGHEEFSLYIKDLRTGRVFENDIINNVISIEWARDGKSVFYTVPDNLRRPWKLYRHIIGQSRDQDTLIFQEDDHSFFVDVTRTKDKKFLVVNVNSKTTSEVHIMDMDKPHEGLKRIKPREPFIEYYIDHVNGKFYIVTNSDGAFNYKVVVAPTDAPTKSNWKTVIDNQPNSRIEDLDIFENYFVTYEKVNGLPKIRVYSRDFSDVHEVPLPEPICTTAPGINLNLQNTQVRFSYSSPLTPEKTYDYCMKTKTLKLLREKQTKGEFKFNPSLYECNRVYLTNSNVPLTLIHRKGITLNNKNPLFITGYGAYGHSTETSFEAHYLSLLERNWVVALAHVRGGSELGAKWYEDGKQLNKKNSFSDFIACTEYLHKNRYSDPSLTAAYASSAGGLLLGSVLNSRPELYKAMIVRVPFVDVVTSMLDPSLPLTVHEYDEWGNPNNPKVLEYILSYDPYRNIRNTNYPSLFVTGSWIDNRVPYWHPAKWVAKLRENSPKSTIVLKMEKDLGHFGDTGRYSYFKDVSLQYAFLFQELGLKQE